MAKPSPRPFSPAEDDLDLTPPEERRARTIRRRLLIAGLLAVVFVAAFWFEAAPAKRAIKAWHSRRLAREADVLIEKSDWKGASEKARDAYQMDSGQVDAWRTIGRLLSRTQQNAAALDWWKKIEQVGQLTRNDRREYAGSALAAGDLPTAATQIDPLIDQAEGPTPADYLLAGQLAARRADPAKALDYTQRTLSDARANPFQLLSGAILVLSLTAPGSSDYIGAWKTTEDLARDPGNVASLEALAFLAQQERPANPSALKENMPLSLAQSTASQPIPTLSANELADRLEKHPRARPYHQLLAMKLRAREEPARADDLLNQAIARFRSSDDETLVALNTWLYKEGRYQTLLDMVPLDRAPRRRELFLQHLDALGALGRFQEVRDLLSSSQSPLDAVSQHMYLATARERLGEVAGAANEWQRALEAADEVEKCMALASYAERAGAGEIADRAYARAISFSPSTRAAYDGRVRVARALGRTADAKKIMTEVCRLWPNDDHARVDEMYLSLLLGAAGSEAERAVHKAETLLKREPMNWQARATVSLAELRLGHPVAALEAFSGIKAMEGSPVGALAVRAAALNANGWKEGAKGDARTLAAAPLLPEERALIAPLSRENGN